MRTRPTLASPPAASWIVAAIVLVLNWTAPGPVHLQPDLDLLDPAPGAYADTRASKPGTLPRAKPRSITYEVSVAKAPHSKLNAGAKPHALPSIPPIAVATHAPAIEPSFGRPAPTTPATRVFDPRAPPAMTA